MLRKMTMALFAVAAIGLVQPTAALARGGHGGGGGGGGGHHGSMGGGSFHSAGMMHSNFGSGSFHAFHDHDRFRDRDHDRDRFHRRAFVGFGFGPYAYDDYYYEDGCYTVRQRVHTRYGWRIRPVQVCG
jgi:hypothetical protein